MTAVPGSSFGTIWWAIFADHPVGHGHEDDVGAGEGLALLDAVEAGRGLEAGAAGLGDLDRGDVEAGPLQVGGEADAHLAAGAEQRDPGHACLLMRRPSRRSVAVRP